MKQLLTLLCILIASMGSLYGQFITDPSQTNTADSTKAPKALSTTLDSLIGLNHRFNFFTSGNPAFNLVDLQPGSVIRPSTPQGISMQVSEFWSGSSLIIPTNFGVQVSPFLMIQRQAKKPSDWAKAWQPLSVAVAASRPDSLSSSNEFVGDFSVGFQYTLIDKAAEKHFDAKLKSHIGTELDSLKPQFETAFVDSVRGLDSSKTVQEIRSTMRSQMDVYVEKAYKAQTISTYNARIADAKKAWKAENWASERLSIAGAASWNASDPLALVFEPDVAGPGTSTTDTLLELPSFTVFRQFESYLTYTVPFPRRPTPASAKPSPKTKSPRQWGMWMISLTYGGTLLDDTTSTFAGIDTLTFDSLFKYNITTSNFYQNVGLSNRFYVGAQRAKAYVEGQVFWDSRVKDQLFYLFDLGVEINIIDGIWMQLYAGVTNSGVEKFVHPGLENPSNPQNQFKPPRAHFLANFDLRFTLPESFYGEY